MSVSRCHQVKPADNEVDARLNRSCRANDPVDVRMRTADNDHHAIGPKLEFLRAAAWELTIVGLQVTSGRFAFVLGEGKGANGHRGTPPSRLTSSRLFPVQVSELFSGY